MTRKALLLCLTLVAPIGSATSGSAAWQLAAAVAAHHPASPAITLPVLGNCLRWRVLPIR